MAFWGSTCDDYRTEKASFSKEKAETIFRFKVDASTSYVLPENKKGITI
jgi:hypothetical protein